MYNVTDEYKALIKSPVRCTAINGAVRLRDGTLIHITDENIAERSLSITHKLNGRGDLRPGGVYSGELRAGLKGFAARTSDLDGAVIRLNFVLYHDGEMTASAAEVVPLGRFYVDGSEIKRSGDTVTLSASDAMLLFDVPAAERSGTLYELVCGSCAAAGVTFGMTQAEFEALPNGTQSAAVNTSRIQTERDLLMYVGMMTASFARISRGNALEFVPLTAETDDKNMIIPVREIAANVRFSTEFSDDTTRISRLITRRNGKLIQSSLVGEAGGSEKRMILELNENPLLAALEESEVVSVLNSELIELHKCLTRVFDTDFTGDPALDAGDYVRLRGGMIDTARGYATGMITSQTWHYRGQHTIKCSMPSSLTPMADADTQAVALMSADDVQVQAAEATPRVQPKSQLEKRVDELEAQCGNTTAESLDRKLSNGSHVTLVPTSSEILLFSYQGKCVAALRGTNSTTRPKNRDADGVELFTSDQNFSATIGAGGGDIRGEYSDSNTGNSARLLISDDSRFEVETITKSSREQYYGNISIKVGTITFRVAGASNSLYYDDGKNTLLFEDGALRINGKKVLTEE